MNDRTKEMLTHHLAAAINHGAKEGESEAGIEMGHFGLTALVEAIQQCENLDSIAHSLKAIAKSLDEISECVSQMNS